MRASLFGLRPRVSDSVVSLAVLRRTWRGQGGDFELGQRPLLLCNVNPSSTFFRQFPQVGRKKGLRAAHHAKQRRLRRDLGLCLAIRIPGQPHSPTSACSGKVEVLLVRKVESFLYGEPGWLLGYAVPIPNSKAKNISGSFFGIIFPSGLHPNLPGVSGHPR